MHRRIDWNVMKQVSGVGVLAAIVFGCAGNTGSGTTSTSTTSTTSTTATTATTATTSGSRVFPEVAAVNLGTSPALVQYVFLTGAGRAEGDEIAVARNLSVSDNIGLEMTDLTERNLTLTSNQSQMISSNVALGSSPSRIFDTLNLNFVRYSIETATGVQSFSSIDGIPAAVPAQVRIFNGRQTHVPIFLDGATIELVNSGSGDVPTWDSTWFTAINKLDSDTTTVRSMMSDYVCFDVSSIPAANRPDLSQGRGTANRIFFSGDQYALGAGDPTVGGAPFETIFPAGQDASVIGRYSSPAVLPGGIATSLTPGSYTTLGVDPTDVTAPDPILARKITSFQGIWKNHFIQRQDPVTGVIQDLGYLRDVHSFEAISIPSSEDDERQDVVFINQTITTNANGTKSATITSMMWGYLDMSTNQIFLYPIKNIGDVDATTNRVGEVAGTISTRYNASGGTTVSVQRTQFIDFNFPTAPAGFPATGKIVVIRR